MQLGLFLLAAQFPGQDHGGALAAAVEYALAAEAAGLDAVWVAEHHFLSYGVCPSALALASYLLGRTTRLEVGTAVCVLSNHHPVAVAEQALLLDHLSGGRFHLGVGRGGPYVDLEVLGTGLARYERGFPEALDLLLRWLRSERAGAAGEFFRFREVPVVPRAAAPGRPPVTVAATSYPTVELAAARGLPLLLGLHCGDEEKAAMLARYAEIAAAHGHDPAAVPHAAAAVACVAPSVEAAAARLRAAMPGWLAAGLGGYVYIDGRPHPRRDPRAYTEHLIAIHPLGPPEACAERLAATAERTGIRRFLLMVEGAGERGLVLETIARAGTELYPLLRP